MLPWAEPFRAAPHQVDEAAKVFISWADQVCSDLSPEVQRDGRGDVSKPLHPQLAVLWSRVV